MSFGATAGASSTRAASPIRAASAAWTGSAAGRLASLPGEATYVGTKHAVVGLSEAVRCELEGTGVTVTTVLPNLANTRLGSGMHAARGMKKLDPAEIADAVRTELEPILLRIEKRSRF